MKFIYIKYSSKYPYLPEAIADSVKELAEKTGHTPGSVSSCVSKGYKMWAKVEVGSEEE